MDEKLLETKEAQIINSPNISFSDTEPLWTVVEVATYLRLEPETIRLMARRGDLPSLKLGKRVWRFRPKEVKDWLSLREAGKHINNK